MGKGAECVEVRALATEELPAGLPTGWKVEVWVRKNGATAGARDMYYRNPMVRRKFRSKEEIIRYFALGKAKKRFPNECAVKSFSPTLTLNHEHRLINSNTRRCHFWNNNFHMGLTTLDVQRFTTAHATSSCKCLTFSITHISIFLFFRCLISADAVLKTQSITQVESPTFQLVGQPKASYKPLLEYGDNFKQNVKPLVDENEVNVGLQSYNQFTSVPWDLANKKQSNASYPKAVDTESMNKATTFRCFQKSFKQLPESVSQSNGQLNDASEISLDRQQVFEVIDDQMSSKYDQSQYLGNGWLQGSDKDEGKGVTKESSNLEFPLGDSSWSPCLEFAVKILKDRIPLHYYDLHARAESAVET